MSSKQNRSARWQAKLKAMRPGESIFLEGEKPSKLTHIYKAAATANIKIAMVHVMCDEIYQVEGTRLTVTA